MAEQDSISRLFNDAIRKTATHLGGSLDLDLALQKEIDAAQVIQLDSDAQIAAEEACSAGEIVLHLGKRFVLMTRSQAWELHNQIASLIENLERREDEEESQIR
jgi:hypothetical protein